MASSSGSPTVASPARPMPRSTVRRGRAKRVRVDGAGGALRMYAGGIFRMFFTPRLDLLGLPDTGEDGARAHLDHQILELVAVRAELVGQATDLVPLAVRLEVTEARAH